MAPTNPVQNRRNQNLKLPALPKTARIQKRPILHPPIPSPYTNSTNQKVVYISPRTPFISAVKRVRSLLAHIDKRAVGQIDLLNAKGGDKQRLKTLGEKVAQSEGKGKEEVVMKATNRAIERVLGLAVYFQGQTDCRVRIRTGGVGVVDDIVQSEEGGEDGDDEGEELPESRIRKLSVVEVAVTLK